MYSRIELKSQLEKLQTKKKGVATFEQILNVFLEGSRATKRYLEVEDVEKRRMLEKLLSNASIEKQDTAYFQFKSPYHVLARTPKNADILTLSACLDSNQGPSP